MNKIICLVLPLLLFTAGCLQVPLGYTPGDPLKKAAPGSPKYDVTYSVDYVADGGLGSGDGIASQAVLADHVRDHLKESGAFSRVEPRPFAEKSNYHIHFIAHYSTISHDEVQPIALLMGLSLCGIPVWITSSLDMSAILYLNQQPVYSPSASEGLRKFIWVGFLPVGLVWNSWWAWTTQEKKCIRFLVNRITDHQRTLP